MKIGDTVQLRSGSPDMVIEGETHEEHPRFLCTWAAGEAAPVHSFSSWFDARMLVPAETA